MWVVGLSLSASPPTISHTRAAAAARRSRGHRVLRVSFRDRLGSVRPEPMSTKNAQARAPLLRFLQRSPLHRCKPPRPAARSEDLLKRLPTSSRGAVLAVFHDFDGFVRRRQCGLVASHYRPWGSPGCMPSNDVSAAPRQFPQALYPPKLSPPDQVDTVTEPLLARSPNVQPLSWLALFCPA